MKITELNPRLVWGIFDEITKVPRPTHHLKLMEEFLLSWAARHGLAAESDEVGNVVMRAPATPGLENAPVIVLQGHQDMVAEKTPDSNHDFMKDPITTIVDGEWVRADRTTLGADNGMGCAAAMACLIDPDLKHGPLEALLTVDEEQGLIGANGLQPGFITGNILLNLDSEEMGTLVVGCAGGMVATVEYPYTSHATPTEGYRYFKVSLSGLTGGHSGMEIGLGRANANQQLCRFLWEQSQQFPIGLSSFNGGGLANAIPRDAEAVVLVPDVNADAFVKNAEEFDALLKEEFRYTEKLGLTFSAVETEKPEKVMDGASAARMIGAVFACPSGVQGMSPTMPGLIETSDNVASVKMLEGDKVEIVVHIRSSVDSRRDETGARVSALFSIIGGKVTFDDAYVGWNPNPDSKVVEVAADCYEKRFGSRPKIEALHAGLECGLFLEKMPGLDMVSFGPTLKDIHSPGEKANIKSVEEFYALLKDIITKLSEQG